MKTIELIEKLRRYPLFTLEDLAKITAQSSHTVRIVASRLVKRKLIMRIERNKYTLQDEPLVVAPYVVYPSYLGLWSAIRFHNLTTEMIKDIGMIVPKKRKGLLFLGRTIHFTKTKHFWGYEKQSYLGFEILVSDVEKTIIDCLLARRFSVSAVFEAIEEALKDGKLDENRLFHYTSRIDSDSLFKRLGYLLERAGMDTKRYLNKVKGSYIKLNPAFKKIGPPNRKWKITENEVIK